MRGAKTISPHELREAAGVTAPDFLELFAEMDYEATKFSAESNKPPEG